MSAVEDSEARLFELNIWLSFSQADLGPTSGQALPCEEHAHYVYVYVSCFCFPSLELCKDLCLYEASGTEM